MASRLRVQSSDAASSQLHPLDEELRKRTFLQIGQKRRRFFQIDQERWVLLTEKKRPEQRIWGF